MPHASTQHNNTHGHQQTIIARLSLVATYDNFVRSSRELSYKTGRNACACMFVVSALKVVGRCGVSGSQARRIGGGKEDVVQTTRRFVIGKHAGPVYV
jgi:hypothetical protein